MAEGACPRCSSTFEYQPSPPIYEEDDGLERALREDDKMHVCASCGVRIQVRTPFLFKNHALSILATVNDDISAAVASWRKHVKDWSPDSFCCFSNRLALKHAVLLRASYSRHLCSLVSLSDRLLILAGWCDEDASTLASRLASIFGEDFSEVLSESFSQAVSDGDLLQVSLRRVARSLKSGGIDLGMDLAPDGGLLDFQLSIVRCFASAQPEDWDKLLELHASHLEPIAIEICWHSSRQYRCQAGGGSSAVAISHLAVYFALRFGTVYERAESMYELAASQLASSDYTDAERSFHRALDFYQDTLARQQPLECLKLLGDVNLVDRQHPDEAVVWYRTAIEVAKLWKLTDGVSSFAANLARAMQVTGDLDSARAYAEEAMSATSGRNERASNPCRCCRCSPRHSSEPAEPSRAGYRRSRSFRRSLCDP